LRADRPIGMPEVEGERRGRLYTWDKQVGGGHGHSSAQVAIGAQLHLPLLTVAERKLPWQLHRQLLIVFSEQEVEGWFGSASNGWSARITQK
jgi:hypothetical protein